MSVVVADSTVGTVVARFAWLPCLVYQVAGATANKLESPVDFDSSLSTSPTTPRETLLSHCSDHCNSCSLKGGHEPVAHAETCG